jgi:hypothetical protein
VALSTPEHFAVVSSFRRVYLQNLLQETFVEDVLTHTLLKDRKKRMTIGLTSNIELECSMLGTLKYHGIGALVTASDDGMLRLWCVGPEETVLVMQTRLEFESSGDKVRQVYLFLKAKCIIVISTKGEALIMSSEKRSEEKIKILGRLESIPTRVLTFQTFNGENLLAVGLE